MAEEERSNRIAPTSQRRPYQQRPNHSNRGRGRQDPHVSKALHYFGVSDLREWLDKKHEQEGQPKGTGPPPDPSFNYLKDPLRENASYEDQTVRQHKVNPEHGTNSWSKGHTPRGSRGKGDFTNRDQRRSEAEKTTFIQNPINIMVEFSTATGERSYKLDEETKLPDIKHIPDHKRDRSFRREKNKSEEEIKSADSKQLPSWQQQERRSFRNERGKANKETKVVEPKRFPTWQHDQPFLKGERGKNVYERGRGDGGWSKGGRNNGERGRGRGERGRGERGRGGRGFGRGRGPGRYNANVDRKFNSNPHHNIPTTEVPTEEDWNSECIDTPLTGNNETEIVGNKEIENVEETDPHYHEQYYDEEGNEYVEANVDYHEENHPAVESETKIELEKNLVISSAVENNKDSRKRTVRFKEKNVEKASNEIQGEQIVSKDGPGKKKEGDTGEGKTVDKKDLKDSTQTENVRDEKLSSEPKEEAATENNHGNEKQ